MVRLSAVLLAMALSSTAEAETPLTGEEFEAHVEGRSFVFGTPLNPRFGVEQYLPDRRVIWSAAPGECLEGVWYPKDGAICFQYEDTRDPRCWRVTREGTGVKAELLGGDSPFVLFELGETDPPVCPGPDLLG